MNIYAEHNPRCYECNECEDIPGSRLATCMTARDAVYEQLGITVSEVKFNPDQDCGGCDNFDPDDEFFERVREESMPLEEVYGLTPPTGLTRRRVA